MGEGFEFSEIQANHILDMQLGRLTRLGRTELEKELAELRADHRRARVHPGRRGPSSGRVIKDELGEVRAKHATARLTELTYDPARSTSRTSSTTRSSSSPTSARGLHQDRARPTSSAPRAVAAVASPAPSCATRTTSPRSSHTTAHAYLLFFSNRGKVYRLKAHEIPMKDRTARGTAMVNLLPLQPDEKIQAIIDTRDYETSRFLFFATKKGQVKKTKFTEYDSSRRDGLIAINLKDDDELVRVIQTTGDDDIFIVATRAARPSASTRTRCDPWAARPPASGA